VLNRELLWVLNYYISIIECMRYEGWNQCDSVTNTHVEELY
jgi:hypothetical protein